MTDTAPASRNLDLLDTSPAADTETGGCGCGGCGCGSAPDQGTATATPEPATAEVTTATRTYAVTGLTCGHCAGAVTNELRAIDGVTDVQVDLVAGGTSTVTVSSTTPVTDSQVTAALNEAGDYQLA